MRLRVMARREDDVGCGVAAREGAAYGSCGSEGGGDAGNDFERDFRGVQSGDFLGGTAVHERVATLEAHDTALGARVLDHQRMYLFLGDVLCAAALAHVDHHCVRRGQMEYRLSYQVVVEDDVG